MIGKFYEKLDADTNLQAYLMRKMENIGVGESEKATIIACAKEAGVDVQVEEIDGYIRAGIEKITQH
ncbi:MAG: hypothetical protein H6Q70_2921 [Firmicutes bacterium]|jgi:hypothetical protein|nr:hypothetical protein [Bacillota bacterium]